MQFSPFWGRCTSSTTVLKESNLYNVICNYIEYSSELSSLTVLCRLVNYDYNALVYRTRQFVTYSCTPTNHSHAKPRSIRKVYKRSFWFSIRGVKKCTPSLEFSELFSLKSIYVKYKNAILSHIYWFFCT